MKAKKFRKTRLWRDPVYAETMLNGARNDHRIGEEQRPRSEVRATVSNTLEFASIKREERGATNAPDRRAAFFDERSPTPGGVLIRNFKEGPKMDLHKTTLLMRLAVMLASIIEERTASKALATLLAGRAIEARFHIPIEGFSLVLIDGGHEIDLGVCVTLSDLLEASEFEAHASWILDLADEAVLAAASYLESKRTEEEERANEFQF